MKNKYYDLERLYEIFEYLPGALAGEIERIILSEESGELNEIRLRADARSSLSFSFGTRYLEYRLSFSDVAAILCALTDDSLYAHRDTLADGFIITRGGVRVGVCGRMRYDGGAFVGVCDVRSLVFRIFCGKCDYEDELRSLVADGFGTGLLVYSAPCGGKTTAIRKIASIIGESGKRVCVVDERCEFDPADYRSSEVEILSGCKKSHGIEISVRTLGAEVVIIDEIGASEASGLFSSLILGIPIVSTVHSASLEELFTRPAFAPFISSGVFETFAGIVQRGRTRRLTVTRRKCTPGALFSEETTPLEYSK